VTATPSSGAKAAAVTKKTLVTFSQAAEETGKAVDVIVVSGPATRTGALAIPTSSARVRSVTKAPDVYALTAAAATNVQVVVIDLDTRGLDAFHFVRNLGAVYPDLRIVALASTPAQVDQARRFGATVVLTKPLSVQVLSSVVTDLIPTAPADIRTTAAARRDAAAAAATAKAAPPRRTAAR
jgi:DNA-binding NarL/FixJ family response regulator